MTALSCSWNLGRSHDHRASGLRILSGQRIFGRREQKSWSDDHVFLGKCGFDLLPEDIFDTGPISGANGQLRLIADIRIDNRDELSDLLDIPPHQLPALSDSAILMKCLERWEDEAASRLRGDWAFVLWDQRSRRILLGRDFLGQKPLHYHVGQHFIAVASMPKGLHTLADVPYAPDLEVVADFLALMPEADDRSFFTGISKVPPGHIVELRPDSVKVTRYWNPSCEPLLLRKSEDYAEAVKESLERAVAVRLRGTNGHVGSHLSSGLDSSSVTATAARLMGQSGGRVSAFTSVPREGMPASRTCRVDEGPMAAETARSYPNVEHVMIRSGSTSPLDGADRNFHLYDRPLLNLVNFVWIHAIRDEAKRRGLSVLLTGSMGNMTVSYSGLEVLPDALAEGRLIGALRRAVALRANGVSMSELAAKMLGPFLPRRLWLALCALRGRGRTMRDHSVLSDSALASLGIKERAAMRGVDLTYRPRRHALATRLWALTRVDFGNYNKGALGGWGIDTRDPTADQNLVELCLSIPAEQFLEGGMPRSLIRRAMADRLPQSVLNQRVKGYQAADWADGFSAGGAEMVIELERLSRCSAAAEILDMARLERLIADWPPPQPGSSAAAQEYRIAMMRGVSAGHFVRKALGTN